MQYEQRRPEHPGRLGRVTCSFPLFGRHMLPQRRRTELASWLVVPVLILGLAGCGDAGSSSQSAAAVTKRLGTFPLANPPPPTIRLVRPGQFALVTMGDTVEILLPGGGRGRLTGLGPSFPSPQAGVPLPRSVMGRAEVAVLGESGTVALDGREFVGTNEQGQAVALRVTPSRVSVQQGQHASVHLTGTFTVGNGALSFLVSGRSLVTWDFSVELD